MFQRQHGRLCTRNGGGVANLVLQCGAADLGGIGNRLRALGCGKVTVNSWSESVGANKLYAAVGLRARARIDGWERKGQSP